MIAQYYVLSICLLVGICWNGGESHAISTDGYPQPIFPSLSSSSSLKSEYGVDISFPIHHHTVSQNYQHSTTYPTPGSNSTEPFQPFGNRQGIYDQFLEGCIKEYDYHTGNGECIAYEQDRINQNLRQPKSMKNYTSTGFTNVKIPEEIKGMLYEFWIQNSENWQPERWPFGNTFTNHWSSPTYMVNIDDNNHNNERGGLRGGRSSSKNQQELIDKQLICDATKAAIENWTQQKNVIARKMYGIRVYTEGAILSPHVDHLPYVFSAVINVAQDVEESWPLELIGHDGIAHNVTIDPGEMILYESHSIIHGRTFPLKGKYMANLFLHFEPVDHTGNGQHLLETEKSELSASSITNLRNGNGGHQVPDYILPNSQSAEDYFIEHWQQGMKERANIHLSSPLLAHTLAARGRTDELIELIEDRNQHLVTVQDANGWTPLHESARSGSIDIAKYLLDQGAQINQRTHDGTGGTPLHFAVEIHGENSGVAMFLESVGAINIAPDPDNE